MPIKGRRIFCTLVAARGVAFDAGMSYRVARSALEVIVGVALGIGVVAALDVVAPIQGLSVVPLLVVLGLAIRRGRAAAAAAAVLSVLALNFFFIAPRYQLTIADGQNVAALVVFLIAALVVGHVADVSRTRAREAHERADEAAARTREAQMLAAVAGRLLVGGSLAVERRWIEAEVARALAVDAVRIDLAPAPSPRAPESAVRLPLQHGAGWLYVTGPADAERIAEPLARLMDLAVERERIGAQAAEAESARRADVAKTAVLHAISHDLRTPLTAITTAGDALAQPGTSDADRAELVSVVREESHRLARMVSDLLDLSRIEAGAVEPRRDWIDLRDVVARAIAGVRAMHPDAVIAFELPEDLPLVRADAAQLERVFANLLENAVKFSAPGAAVQVRGAASSGRVTVRVVDHGPGIPPGQRAKVFEPFVRLGERRGGAGLGLAISRGFVEANGGRIALQSGPEGGAAFAVSLPLAPSPAPVS